MLKPVLRGVSVLCFLPPLILAVSLYVGKWEWGHCSNESLGGLLVLMSI